MIIFYPLIEPGTPAPFQHTWRPCHEIMAECQGRGGCTRSNAKTYGYTMWWYPTIPKNI